MPQLRRGLAVKLASVASVTALALLVCLAAPTPARAGTVLRGICAPGLIGHWSTDGPAVVRQFAERLGADVVRVNIHWYEAAPSPGTYDDQYLGRVTSAVREIRARGMQVIVGVWGTPRWASDRALWVTAAPGDRAGVYHRYYPPALDHLEQLRALMERLSADLQGEVLGYVCWNEPNLWTYLYPQRTSSNAAFAARRYAKMLAAFSQGVRGGDANAQVIAGETAPFGENSVLRTSPQRFARLLARQGASAWFDAYSHHPYAIASRNGVAPNAQPRDPEHTVNLGNLDTLVKVFADRPLYITELGYPTRPNAAHGFWVSPARQASYLRAAFRVATAHDGVAMLVWFPLHDSSNTGTYANPWGNYSGLVTLGGRPKRAYYAFAGGNSLTLADPGRVARAGATLVLRGVLTSVRMGPLAGKGLTVLARRPGSPWIVAAQTMTRGDGSYVVRLRVRRGATWKVRWTGVVTSPRHWVPVG